MSKDNFRTTRRSVLKLAGTAAVGAAGFSSAATAAGVEWDEDDIVRDDDGKSEWILRIDRQVSDDAEVTVEKAKETAETSQQQVRQALSTKQGYTVEKQFWLANAILVKADKDVTPAKNELSALSGVRIVHPNFEFEGPEPVEKQELVPEKSHLYTYGLNHINAPDVWDQFDTQGEGTSVAVLDTGVDADHPDIELAEDGWAFFDGEGNEVDSEPFDPNGHGTHTSGTVAGGDASGLHIGVAPETDLYHAKVLDNGGTWAQIIAGVEWAVGEKAVDAINMSLGATGYFDTFIEPVQNATSAGTIVVSSSGNSGPGTSGTPANVYESFAIGATNGGRNVAGFSSGERIKTSEAWVADWLTEDWPLNYYVPDVSAPGVAVLSSYPGGDWTYLSGTSMASPHVAGSVALLLSAKPDLDVGGIKEYMETTAIHGDGPDSLPGPRYGEGIIDILSAITAATDGNVVEGTVTYDGDPYPGAVVETDFGTRAETDENGEFSLYVGDGEWTLTVDEFGFVSEDVTVDVSGGQTVEQDIELVDELDIRLTAPQPDVVGQGETFQIMATVANLESLTVCLADGSDLSEEDLTVRLGGEELAFCEPFEFDEPYTGEATLTVEVSESATIGEFSLEHEFEGVGESIQVQTGPTEVMEDPEDANLEIVDWDETTEVEMGETLQTWAIVENTGDRTARQPVSWWLGDPEGINVFTADFVALEGGEQKEVPFPIGIPAAFVPPGTEIPHGWKTDDDLVDTVATFQGPLFVFGDVDAPDQVDYGDTMELAATVQNVGNLEGEDSIDFYFDDVWIESKDVEAAVGGTDSVTFEFDSTEVVRDQYNLGLFGTWGEDFEEARFTNDVWIGPPQLPELDVTGDGRPATDTAGDGLLNDVNGDGEFDMADVQAFYRHLDDDIVQENAAFFNFADDSPPEVGIRDVQALYSMVRRA